MRKRGMIFNIQRYSVHDGPGIRSTVFVKGCPLKCLWCCNPESQKTGPEITHRNTKCNSCGRCVPACPQGAINLCEGGVAVNRQLCDLCGKCIDVCYEEALEIVGTEVDVPEVMAEVLKDVEFYRNSQGGVTISGGEPGMQSDFVTELLAECKRHNLHTTLDTSGQMATGVMANYLDNTDLVLLDIKHMDTGRHQQLTGVGNERILANAKQITERRIPVIICIPIVPGMNDSRDNLENTARFIKTLPNVVAVDLLRYHRYGASKYENLDTVYPTVDLSSPTDWQMQHNLEIFKSAGLKAQIGR